MGDRTGTRGRPGRAGRFRAGTPAEKFALHATPYYDGELEDLMPQSVEKAKAALKESGYNGEKVVIISPTDFPDIGPLGDVTYELLKSLGMNVEFVASDWGTVIQRRNSREPEARASARGGSAMPEAGCSVIASCSWRALAI